MSSTNRGRDRTKDDLYETPEWLTEAICHEISAVMNPEVVLEPACGPGKMVKAMAECWPLSDIHQSDITEPYCRNFLNPDHLYPPMFDLIITNPPFSLAMEFVQTAMKCRRTAYSMVAMLLRLNWLGSQKRAKWLRAHRPAVFVTPRRPNFSDAVKTDSCEYAWFLWHPLLAPEIHILETE